VAVATELAAGDLDAVAGNAATKYDSREKLTDSVARFVTPKAQDVSDMPTRPPAPERPRR
jgi:hypothetical protein